MRKKLNNKKKEKINYKKNTMKNESCKAMRKKMTIEKTQHNKKNNKYKKIKVVKLFENSHIIM